MARRDIASWSALILAGIVITPILWIYQKIGTLGLFGIAAVSLAVYFVVRARGTEKDKEAFSALALETMRTRLTPSEESQINRNLASTNFKKAEVIRALQIIRDSIWIIRESKKPDTVESRLDVMRDCFKTVVKRRDLLTDVAYAGIEQAVQKCITDAPTTLAINIAKGHIEHAAKLKTAKSQEKYHRLAREVIEQAISAPDADQAKLKQFMSALP